MYAVPSVDEVVAVAKSLGIHLGPDEAVLYRKYLLEQLDQFDAFVQSRIEGETAPPRYPGPRAPGYKPSATEDPLNAWMWKCMIPGADSGLLAGKTVSYKDHVAVAGIPMSWGTFALDGFIPDFDATIVSRVLEAGGTIIGKQVMNGLAGGYGSGGGIGDYGRPMNPHNPEHLTGGSSSGSGVSVATGEVDISFGGDQGGSIRSPAAWCGIMGLKPTFGLISHFGLGFGSDQSIDYTGPMARTAEDMAAALQATAGYDGLDPRQTHDVPMTMEVLAGLQLGVDGLRIGIIKEGTDPADPDVKDLMMAALDVLSRNGATITEVSIPDFYATRSAQNALGEGPLSLFKTGFFGAFTRTYYPPAMIAAINEMWASHADTLAPRTKASLIAAEMARKNYNGRVYAKGQNVRAAFIKMFDAALADVDVLVLPTRLTTAPKYKHPGTFLESIEDNLAYNGPGTLQNTQQFDYTGHPALAMPVGKSAAGLPASMQLVGKFFDDPLLLRVAYAYQHSVDWDATIGVKSGELVTV
jgi:amidase